MLVLVVFDIAFAQFAEKTKKQQQQLFNEILQLYYHYIQYS